jgi:hypothetical protein
VRAKARKYFRSSQANIRALCNYATWSRNIAAAAALSNGPRLNELEMNGRRSDTFMAAR